MSVLVVDGVRRRRSQGGPVLTLQPPVSVPANEAILPMPNTWGGRGGAFDGLRRVAASIATDQPVPSDFELTPALPGRQFSPWAIASLTAIPMVTFASIVGARTLISDHTASVKATRAASAKPIAEAQPVSAADQAALVPAEGQSMQQLLDGFGLSGTYSLYVKDLKTGQLAITAPDRVFESASLYKLFVATAIYQRIDSGQLAYSAQAGSGTGNTIAGCLNLMITISDNGCGQALGSLLNWNSLTQQMRAQGYDATNLTGAITYTTPRNVATLYERLYAGSLLSADSTNQFMTLLKAQKVNNRLPQGLPAGTTFAHKTGDLDGYLHDAGIVFGPKTDYLVVMMGAPGANPNDFANLSQKLYSFFNN